MSHGFEIYNPNQDEYLNLNNRHNTMMVIGGCRSGKSTYALDHCNHHFEKNKYFLATCQPLDPEMEQRVITHQRERGKDWITVEEPLFLLETLQRLSHDADVILVDCLTLWVSNLMAREEDASQVIIAARQVAESLETICCPVVFVSNEVGTGIVPENQLARLFRDTAGMVNQIIARHVDIVTFMVAGYPLQVKPQIK